MEHQHFKEFIKYTAVAFLLVLGLLWLLRALRGPKKVPLEEATARRCALCGYYLVPSDTTCPKCHAPTPPPPPPVPAGAREGPR